MVVDDFQKLVVLKAFDRLACLVVVHKNQFHVGLAQQVAFRNHAQDLVVIVNDRQAAAGRLAQKRLYFSNRVVRLYGRNRTVGHHDYRR